MTQDVEKICALEKDERYEEIEDILENKLLKTLKSYKSGCLTDNEYKCGNHDILWGFCWNDIASRNYNAILNVGEFQNRQRMFEDWKLNNDGQLPTSQIGEPWLLS